MFKEIINNLFTYKNEKDYSFIISNTSNNISEKEFFKQDQTVVSKQLNKNLEYLTVKLNLLINSDIKIRHFNIPLRTKNYQAFLIYIDGMVDSNNINNFVLEPLFLRNSIKMNDSIIYTQNDQGKKCIRYNLENFLFSSSENRRWINNQNCFNGIEEIYQKANKPIKLKNEKDCESCKVKHSCCAVKNKNGCPLLINNNGEQYHLCKTNDFNDLIKKEEIIHINQDCAQTNNLENNLISNQNTFIKPSTPQKGHKADKLLEIYNQKRRQYSKESINSKEKKCSNCKKQNYCFTRERYNFYDRNSSYFFANQCHEYEPI